MMWPRKTRKTASSKGQVLPMAALMMAVLVAATGLAIDAGRCFIARAELVRAVDAAALAGTLELPNLTVAQAKAITYMTQNEPDAVPQAVISPVERQIQVTGTKSVDVIFMRVFGISSVDVSASATAGFGILAVDTVMAIDATGSMGVDQMATRAAAPAAPSTRPRMLPRASRIPCSRAPPPHRTPSSEKRRIEAASTCPISSRRASPSTRWCSLLPTTRTP